MGFLPNLDQRSGNTALVSHLIAEYDRVILYHTMQSRITITIPEELVEAADAKAESLGRSRSWVLVEALRRYLAEVAARAAVREPTATEAPGLGPYRQAQLQADLSLSPEQRVKEAQRTAKTHPYDRHARHDQFLTFDTYEAYVDWKRRRDFR